MNREFIEAINELEKEKHISKEVLIEAIESALVSAYKKNYGTSQNVRVDIDREDRDIAVLMKKDIVEEVWDDMIEMSLEEAQEIDPRYEIGDAIEFQVTPRDFGRIAAQTAKQVVVQRIREAERGMIFDDFITKQGEIVTGVVQRKSGETLFVNMGKAEGILSVNEQVPGERFEVNERLKVFIIFVAITMALQYYQEKNIRLNNLNSLLQEYNHHVANNLTQYLSNDSTDSKHTNTPQALASNAYRLTIISADDGSVLLDNSTTQVISTPHINRPEIKAAINGEKKCYSVRYSETLKQTFFYAAYRKDNYIIRTSIPYDETISHILHVDPLFRYILIAIATAFVIALYIYCRMLGRSISNLDKLAHSTLENKPLDSTEEIATDPLGHITQTLRKNYEEIRKAREALAIEEEKLLAHIQTSREGIAIFTSDKEMIVSNNLFIQYANQLHYQQ